MRKVFNRLGWVGFLSFISGVMISGLVSLFFGGLIRWTEGILGLVTVLALLAGTYFFAQSHQRIQSLADNLDVATARYVEESYREPRIGFDGAFYVELAEVVKQAEHEILAYGATQVEGVSFNPSGAEHASRKQYLRTLEETMKQNSTRKFTYIRVLNIPRQDRKQPLSAVLDRETREHCSQCFHIEQRHFEQHKQKPLLTLSILQIPTDLLISFMIVDQKQWVLEVDGINEHGQAYAVGMIFLRDRSQAVISYFNAHFARMVQLAQPVRPEELR